MFDFLLTISSRNVYLPMLTSLQSVRDFLPGQRWAKLSSESVSTPHNDFFCKCFAINSVSYRRCLFRAASSCYRVSAVITTLTYCVQSMTGFREISEKAKLFRVGEQNDFLSVGLAMYRWTRRVVIGFNSTPSNFPIKLHSSPEAPGIHKEMLFSLWHKA